MILIMNVIYLAGLNDEMEQRLERAQQSPNKPRISLQKRKRPIEEVPSFYTAVDCLVQPYRAEGFGYVST